MILLVLLVFGLIGFLVDIIEKKEGITWGLVWTNFKGMILLSLFYAFVFIWTMTLYQMGTLIDLNEIMNRNIFYRIELYLFSLIPVFSLLFGMIILLFKKRDKKNGVKR